MSKRPDFAARVAQGRIPVRLHRCVSVLQTADSHMTEEILSRKKLAALIAGRLTDTVLLVSPGQEQAVQEELRRLGHTPQIVPRNGDS